MLEVTFPIILLLRLIVSPFFATPSTTRIPQVLHFLSELINADLPMKSFFSKSTNLPKPTEKGLVSLVKSWPADRRPASILLPLKKELR